ncbi:hypothetical protein AeMF1_017619 [Aphanomyces euteiches]|nr:hypothetical protein AeMF1_017619 [Aphanomyces euteiches]KAH9196507.1 hypothetical protein AeNC1_001531 [Aphanomyces euteiches]
MASQQLPPLNIDAKPSLGEVELEGTTTQSDCSSVGSDVNLIDDHTPTKVDLKETPLTKMNLIAGGSVSSPLLTYKTCRNILFALFLPAILIGHFAIFHVVGSKHATVENNFAIDSKHLAIGAVAYICAEALKLVLDHAMLQSSSVFPDGATYPWGPFGVAIFVFVDDFMRLVFGWFVSSTHTFVAGYSFGLGWASVELLCLLLSFLALCCGKSLSFSEATRMRRVLTRAGIRNYSLYVWVVHFFSVACAIGAALLVFKTDSKFLPCIIFFVRMIGYTVQNECLKRRCAVLSSSFALFVLQVVLLLMGLSVWQWGAVVAVTAAKTHHTTTAAPVAPGTKKHHTPTTTHHGHGHHHDHK